MKTIHRIVPAFCAAILTTQTGSASAQFQSSVCPKLENQFVGVTPGEPVAFTILVTDLGDGEVSIFGYPLGGILEHTGTTPLDFVFIPDDGFHGSTTFAYRVTPEAGCEETVLLGRVTLAGGTTGRPFPVVSPGVCAEGIVFPSLATCALFGMLGARRTRRSR